MNRNTFSFSFLLLIIGLLSSVSVYSAEAKTSLATANIELKGKILNPPPICTFNNNEPIYVNFGNNVVISKIEQDNYQQKFNYDLSCTGDSKEFSFKVSVKGDPAVFDNQLLATSVTDLAIKIVLNNTELLPVNKKVKVERSKLPEFSALLVKKQGANLAEGKFRSSASVIFEYE
ncbi:fimbrial protein [Proteus sp. fly-1013]|uniref:fimbrial protein n=1 Tax=Proteus sp. fly-1013 TaxID=3136673 RepID=UPI0032DA62C9